VTCPVVIVHGNHEGFAHLETLYPRRRRHNDPVPLEQLPPVDTNGRILLLPAGWRAITAEGYTIAGVGGIEAGQRKARYHPMAYIEDDAVQHLLLQESVDVTVDGTNVVPLGDVAFQNGTPELRGWSILNLSDQQESAETDPPPFWREVTKHHWHMTPQGWFVHPDLVRFMP
jgi:hypothetical protein